MRLLLLLRERRFLERRSVVGIAMTMIGILCTYGTFALLGVLRRGVDEIYRLERIPFFSVFSLANKRMKKDYSIRDYRERKWGVE